MYAVVYPSLLLWALSCACAVGQSLVALDAAASSSTHSSGSFGAEEAISKGSGYWCSAGRHAPGQSITWTGKLGARRKVLGVNLNWAYGPGEYKVLTSSDGGNFEEATFWRAPKRTQVSYEDIVMFEAAQNVKALTIVMRSSMPWGYFGLNDVSLIAEPGPMMLVSGVSSGAGELCLVATATSVWSESCLRSIAAGAGEEVFLWNEASQIVSATTGQCVSLANGDTARGGKVVLQDCGEASEAGDGRSNFELTASGQLKFKHMGNYCLVVSQEGGRVLDCSAAEESAAAQDNFFPSAVSEFSSKAATDAWDMAAVLNAAASRQSVLLGKLQAAIANVGSCKFALSRSHGSHGPPPVSLGNKVRGVASADLEDPAKQAIAAMYSSLGVDMGSINRVIADASGALAAVMAKVRATSTA